MASSDDIDDFLERVSSVHQSVVQLRDGQVTPAQIDAKTEKRKALEERAKAEAEAAAKQKIERGRDGKGAGGEYEVYCRRCHVEFAVRYEKCTRCGGAVISQEVRRAELHAAVEKLKSEKEERRRRRERWANFKAQRALSNSVVVTASGVGGGAADAASGGSSAAANLASYQSWDAWCAGRVFSLQLGDRRIWLHNQLFTRPLL